MLAAFLRFNEETILALGFTHRDLLAIASGDEPPAIDIAKLCISLGSPLPSQIQIIAGATNAEMNDRIAAALGVEVSAVITVDPEDVDEAVAEIRAEAEIAKARAAAARAARPNPSLN